MKTVVLLAFAAWLFPGVLVGFALALAIRRTPAPVELSPADHLDLALIEHDPAWIDRLTEAP